MADASLDHQSADEQGSDTLEGGGSHQTTNQQQQWQPPNDGSWVPRERLDAVVAKASAAEERLAALEAQRNKKEDKPRYTRAQLDSLVEEGKISQDQADSVLEEQIAERAANAASEAVSHTQKTQRITDTLQEYAALVPELDDFGSDAFKRVATELNYHMHVLGQPNTPETQLSATRAVFGPIEALRESPKPSRKRESAQEGSGSEDAPNPPKPGEIKWDDLSTREKRGYDRMISNGVYADHAEVVKDINEYGRSPKHR